MTKKEQQQFAYFLLIQITAFLLATNLIGCASINKSAGLGGVVGAGTGAIAGGLANPGKDGEFRTRNVIIGTALGGMSGLITGGLIHQEMEAKKQEAFQKGRASAPTTKGGAMPALKGPQVESRWVEAHIVGNKYIDGHFEYIITTPAKWDESQ
jgi:hypothetical protein